MLELRSAASPGSGGRILSQAARAIQPKPGQSRGCVSTRDAETGAGFVFTIHPMRRAKIVCTLGPATSSPEMIGQLIDAGMDVARLNFSHGERDAHLKALQAVRNESQKRDRAVAVLLDVQGPKIRVGRFASGPVELVAGREFVITTDTAVAGDEHRVSTTYAGLPGDVRPGALILLDDGLLTLEVTDVRGNDVVTV